MAGNVLRFGWLAWRVRKKNRWDLFPMYPRVEENYENSPQKIKTENVVKNCIAYFVNTAMLLLNTKWKSYMGSTTAPSDLTLSDLERPKPRSHRFGRLLSCKGAALGQTSLLSADRKHVESNCIIRLDLQEFGHTSLLYRATLKGQSQGHIDFEWQYFLGYAHIFRWYLALHEIWMKHKTICGQAGFISHCAIRA